MTNQLVKYQSDSGEIALDKQTIKNYLVSGDASKVTDQELEMFLNLCKYQKLNPFLRDAYLVKYGTTAANIIVGKDFFMKRATANPDFKNFEAGVIVLTQDNQIIERAGSFYVKGLERLVGGWVKIYKKDGSEFYHTVAFDEYSSGKSTWLKIPATMIRKVALVQGLRECFPSDFQGLYDSSEMGVEGSTLPNKEVDLNNPTINSQQASNLLEIVGKEIIVQYCKEKEYKTSADITITDYEKLIRDFEEPEQEIIEPEFKDVSEDELFEVNEEDLPI